MASAGSAGSSGGSYRDKFLRLDRLVRLVAASKINALYCYGAPGIGKSSAVLKTLADCGLVEGEHFVTCKGTASVMGLYQLLFKHNDGRLILFDDCDGVLHHRDGANLLKACLDDKPVRTVSYLSSRLPHGVPAQFDFRSRVIFISNVRLTGTKDPNLSAIESRCFVVDLFLSRLEILEFLEVEVIPQPYMTTNEAQRRYVLRRLRAAISKAQTPLSLRLYRQVLDLFIHDREHFTAHLQALVPKSDEIAIIQRLLDTSDSVNDAAARWAEMTGFSRRTFFLKKARYRDILVE